MANSALSPEAARKAPRRARVRSISLRRATRSPAPKAGEPNAAPKAGEPNAAPKAGEPNGDMRALSGQRPTAQPPTHYAQVLDAEAGRLARELRTIGPMTRQALAERCGVRGWRQGSFEAAVRRGVATGRLRQLPYGFLAAPGRPPRR